MNVAILSQGPSVTLWPGTGKGYDLVIGVNRVIEHWTCDWWAFADTAMFVQVTDVFDGPYPEKFWTKKDLATDLRNDADFSHAEPRWPPLKERAVFESDLKPLPQAYIDTCQWKRLKYTGCYALWLAWHLGATRVDTFGVDLGGWHDYRGRESRENPRSRNAVRWKRERETWRALCAALEAEGLAIYMNRLLPWRAVATESGGDDA